MNSRSLAHKPLSPFKVQGRRLQGEMGQKKERKKGGGKTGKDKEKELL
jgi:hypothetical protein